MSLSQRTVRLRRQLAAVALLVGCTATALAAPRRAVRVRPIAVPPAAMSFSFIALGDGAAIAGSGSPSAVLDIGAVSAQGAAGQHVRVRPHRGGIVVSTLFGIVVSDPGASGRTATLMAALPQSNSRVSVKIDGVPVDASPRIVASHIVPGRPSAHRVEIEVSADVTEANSNLFSNILFSVFPE